MQLKGNLFLNLLRFINLKFLQTESGGKIFHLFS